MSRLSRPALLTAALLAPFSALATVVLSLSMEEMTARAPLVVHATVHGSESGWDQERAKIWTWTELVVKDTLKGGREEGADEPPPGAGAAAVADRAGR